jgi:hypothetical protein
MNTQEIKAYCEEQLEKSHRLIPTERTASYYEEQVRLRQLWIASEQAEHLAFIGARLDSIQSYLGAMTNAVELLERGG